MVDTSGSPAGQTVKWKCLNGESMIGCVEYIQSGPAGHQPTSRRYVHTSVSLPLEPVPCGPLIRDVLSRLAGCGVTSTHPRTM